MIIIFVFLKISFSTKVFKMLVNSSAATCLLFNLYMVHTMISVCFLLIFIVFISIVSFIIVNSCTCSLCSLFDKKTETPPCVRVFHVR